MKAVIDRRYSGSLPTRKPVMPADDLSFRSAGSEAAGELLEWVREYYACDGIAFDAAAMAPALERLLRDPALGRAYFITRERQRIGYTIFTFGYDVEFGGPLATVTDLFLQPAERGRGAGMATLEFIAATCRAAGVCALELQVEQHNLPAQRLYKKFGFRQLSRLPMHLDLDQ